MDSPRKAAFRTARDQIFELEPTSKREHDNYVTQAKQAGFLSPLRYNLSISHARKFVWFRVAKAGTRSIFQHLHQHAVPLDVVHAMWIHYPTSPYQAYFKFAFVRHPWPRLLAAWRDKVLQNNYFRFDEDTHQKMCDFEQFLSWVELQDLRHCDHHLCLQSRLVDLTQIDFLGRIENLEHDLTCVSQKLEIPLTDFPRLNSTAEVNSVDGELLRLYGERVRAAYARDFQIFGYDW